MLRYKEDKDNKMAENFVSLNKVFLPSVGGGKLKGI